jgi:hypothetical protein
MSCTKLAACDLVHPLVLLLHLVNLSQLLKLMLVLHQLLGVGVLHIGSNQASLVKQLLPLLLETLLLEVWDQHTGLLPLVVEELPDSSLNLDSSKVLGCHGSTPRLLDDSLYK